MPNIDTSNAVTTTPAPTVEQTNAASIRDPLAQQIA